jgi:hypothetical protein
LLVFGCWGSRERVRWAVDGDVGSLLGDWFLVVGEVGSVLGLWLLVVGDVESLIGGLGGGLRVRWTV